MMFIDLQTGGYARPAVVVARPVVVVRRGRWGRKLLQENAGQYTPSGDCQSMLGASFFFHLTFFSWIMNKFSLLFLEKHTNNA